MPSKTAGDTILVHVFLYAITPKIWRKFSIPLSANFLDLHDAIQCAMGWANKHPHEFRHGKGKRLVDVIGPVGLEDQVIGNFRDELGITIREFIGRKRLPLRMLYRYDFADEWVHELIFEKRLEGSGGPSMIGGERACPPEDFGGSFQYMQAAAGEIEWARPGYDPAVFVAEDVDFSSKPRRKER